MPYSIKMTRNNLSLVLLLSDEYNAKPKIRIRTIADWQWFHIVSISFIVCFFLLLLLFCIHCHKCFTHLNLIFSVFFLNPFSNCHLWTRMSYYFRSSIKIEIPIRLWFSDCDWTRTLCQHLECVGVEWKTTKLKKKKKKRNRHIRYGITKERTNRCVTDTNVMAVNNISWNADTHRAAHCSCDHAAQGTPYKIHSPQYTLYTHSSSPPRIQFAYFNFCDKFIVFRLKYRQKPETNKRTTISCISEYFIFSVPKTSDQTNIVTSK